MPKFGHTKYSHLTVEQRRIRIKELEMIVEEAEKEIQALIYPYTLTERYEIHPIPSP